MGHRRGQPIRTEQYAAEMAPETFYKKAETEIKIQGMNLSIDS